MLLIPNKEKKRISEIKKHLENVVNISFQLPNGELIPEHFHITEIGLITKHFIDCGGTERFEKVVNFQLWLANDFDHRLNPQKLLDIISLSEQKLGIGDFEVEVEYQTDTIGKYNLDFNENNFILIPQKTNCLAQDNCGIPKDRLETSLSNLKSQFSSCSPGGGCC